MARLHIMTHTALGLAEGCTYGPVVRFANRVRVRTGFIKENTK